MSSKVVKVSEFNHGAIGSYANKHKVSNDVVIGKMLGYFQRNGVDPFTHEEPKAEITKLIKRFDQMFGFLKKQENEHIIPTLKEVARREQLEESTNKLRTNQKLIFETIGKENAELKKVVLQQSQLIQKLQEQQQEAQEQQKAELSSLLDSSTHNVAAMLEIIAKNMGKMAISNKTEVLAQLNEFKTE